jgi:hypothetical protein
MNLPPWSASMLKTYLTCPLKAQHEYVLKDLPKTTSPELERGTYMHEAMEARIGSGKALPEDMSQHEYIAQGYIDLGAKAELKLGVRSDGSPCDFFAPDVPGRGVIDIVVIKDTSAFIGDWKSGGIREDPVQLLVYSLLLQAHYPELTKVKGRYIWLSQLKEKMGMVHNVTDTAAIAKMIEGMLTKMREYNDAEWPKTKNGLCGYCPCTTCEHQPPAYARRLKKGK